MSADELSGSKASSPTEQKSQIDFQFLNFSHPADAKASRARKTVRSHVTRQQHQKEHAAAAARRAKSYPQPEDEDDDRELELPSTGRRHAATFPPNRPTLTLPSSSEIVTSPEASSQSPSPTNSPAYPTDVRVELSEVYPDEWRPYVSGVVDYYIDTIVGDTPAIDGPDLHGLLKTRFYPFCLTDLASLHAFVLIAASHFSTSRGSRSHAINILDLRGMAISEINKALEDTVRATSDQVIAAVANMASYEALFGDQKIFNTHMTGLLRMVSLRGGLPALGLDGLLERILLWIDSNTARIMGTELCFDPDAFPSTVTHPQPDLQRFTGRSAQRPPP